MLIIIIHILNHNAINFYKKYENHKIILFYRFLRHKKLSSKLKIS